MQFLKLVQTAEQLEKKFEELQSALSGGVGMQLQQTLEEYDTELTKDSTWRSLLSLMTPSIVSGHDPKLALLHLYARSSSVNHQLSVASWNGIGYDAQMKIICSPINTDLYISAMLPMGAIYTPRYYASSGIADCRILFVGYLY